jgi:hypothetical protein
MEHYQLYTSRARSRELRRGSLVIPPSGLLRPVAAWPASPPTHRRRPAQSTAGPSSKAARKCAWSIQNLGRYRPTLGTVGVSSGGGIPWEPGGDVGITGRGLGVSVAVTAGVGLVCAGGAPPMQALPAAPALSIPRATRVQFIAASRPALQCVEPIRHAVDPQVGCQRHHSAPRHGHLAMPTWDKQRRRKNLGDHLSYRWPSL